MLAKPKVWAIRVGIFSTTCLGVFVLPFLLPPPYFQGVSASNLAGFNNRIAALAAAAMALIVFLLSLRLPEIGDVQIADLPSAQAGRLSRRLVLAIVLAWTVAVSLSGWLIIRRGVTYTNDWGYFINRASMHADFGRKLYTQIEFPYGPMLFYGPIAVRALLSPFQVSAAGAYLVTLTLEIAVGILLIAYVIDYLPMSSRWKALIFLLLAVGMLPANMGLNYTLFRFAPPLAFLVMASRRRRLWATAIWIFLGQMICLGLSPEIGFAFFFSSFLYIAYQCLAKGWGWFLGPGATVLSTLLFLLLMGGPYLRMVRMYAHGVMSFPVEPLPHILLFLFAFVWLAPTSIARFFRQQRPEAPMLAALYLVSAALLPVAFGRADPWHVYWNGLSTLLLSGLAISFRGRVQQIAWGGLLAGMILWMCAVNLLEGRSEIGPVVHDAIAELKNRAAPTPRADDGIDLQSLQAIVGHDFVVLPAEVPVQVEASLRGAGQYTPTFYYFTIAILDPDGEDREIQEFNQSKWALIETTKSYGYFESPEKLKVALGFQLPYRTLRPIYRVGLRFEQNLAKNWKVRGQVGRYTVYENVTACHGCGKQAYGLAGGM